MSLTFTVKSGSSNAITFSGITIANASRQAIDFDAGAAHQKQFRFHQPGVAGQWLIRDAQVGRHILMVVRYMDATLDLAEALWVADRDAWVINQCEIVAMGQTYKGCNVIPESLRRSAPIRATGRTPANAGQVFFNVAMAWTQDNPAGV